MSFRDSDDGARINERPPDGFISSIFDRIDGLLQGGTGEEGRRNEKLKRFEECCFLREAPDINFQRGRAQRLVERRGITFILEVLPGKNRRKHREVSLKGIYEYQTERMVPAEEP